MSYTSSMLIGKRGLRDMEFEYVKNMSDGNMRVYSGVVWCLVDEFIPPLEVVMLMVMFILSWKK